MVIVPALVKFPFMVPIPVSGEAESRERLFAIMLGTEGT
jgi:hypothetical protein